MKQKLLLALIAIVTTVAVAEEVVAVHGSGGTAPINCYWHIMDQIMIQSKNPVRLTYRAVGSSTGQAEFIGNVTYPKNFFGSGEIPLSSSQYASLTGTGVGIVQLPFALGAISVFHSVETSEPLNLTACTIAQIFTRQITDWTDERILATNPKLSLPKPYPITVARRVLGSGTTATFTGYLGAACPSKWNASLVGAAISWPSDTKECEGNDGMTACLQSIVGAVGYIDSGHGTLVGLKEVRMQNADGNFLNSQESIAQGGVLAAAENAGFPSSNDQDFGKVTVLNQVRRFHCRMPVFVNDKASIPFRFHFFSGWPIYMASGLRDLHVRSKEFDSLY